MKEKEEGERLARIALDSGIPMVQLRKLYDIAKSMSVDDLELFIKYQMPRIAGYWNFGSEALSILDKYKDNKSVFLRVLENTIMLYEYLDVKSFMDLKPTVSEIVRGMSQRYGFEGVDFSFENGEKRIIVVLSRFYGSPQEYASEIYRQIMRSLPEASKHRFKVRIEKRR